MSSCIYDYRGEGDDTPTVDSRQTLFVLHISPMAMRSQPSDRVIEKIKSLRVIAISKGEKEDGTEDVIEINRLIKFNDLSVSAFKEYPLTWTTNPGHKEFYIFANEESVPELKFADGADVPDDFKSMTLNGLFDQYKATPNEKFKITPEAGTSDTTDNTTENGATGPSAADFRKAINAVCFAPQYTITPADDAIDDSEATERETYLPYSTFYKIEAEGGKSILKEMFLVPVATKFYFRFYNYHEKAVNIQELTIKKTDSDNFLLGQVGTEEQEKVFNSFTNQDDPNNGKRLYWVDWLKLVADETHKNLTPDNSELNGHHGWISDYSMPETSVWTEQTLIGGDGTGLVGGRLRLPEATIPARGPLEDMAGELYLGPYYFPESRHMVSENTKDEKNQDITITYQQYVMGLKLHDTAVDSATSHDFDEALVIENVRSLFRDTCVLIQVTMREGDVEVYAEMADWVHKEVEGWAGGGDQL